MKRYRLKAKYRPKNMLKKIFNRSNKNKKYKRRVKNKIVLFFILFCLIIFCFSLYHIIKWKLDNNENKKISTEISQNVAKEDDKYKIDFAKLKTENADTVAYIKVKNTNIDYFVVKGEDNSFYLNHNFKRNYNIAGWIFADYRNKFDGSDKNITIYGHNMRDGSMFGTLKYVLTSDWYENKGNLKVTFVTEKDSYNYEVFSVYKVKKEEYFASNNFKNDDEYEKFLNKITERSEVDFKIKPNKDNKILTLSTCDRNNNYRVVMHTVLK